MKNKILLFLLIIGGGAFISISCIKESAYDYLHEKQNIINVKEIEFFSTNKGKLGLGRLIFKLAARSEIDYIIEEIISDKLYTVESGGESVFLKFKCLNRSDFILKGYLDYNNGNMVIILESSIGMYKDRYVRLKDRHYWDVIRNYYNK